MDNVMLALNHMLNQIHTWGQPEQYLAKRIFLTRILTVACSALEACALASCLTRTCLRQTRSFLQWMAKQVNRLTLPPQTLPFANNHVTCDAPESAAPLASQSLALLGKLIAGLASSLLLGVFLSPEINFRIHRKLGLVDNCFVLDKQKFLQARLLAEAQAREVEAARAAKIDCLLANTL